MAHYSSLEKIIKKVANQTNHTIAECTEIYNSMIDEFVNQFQSEGKVKINRLGTLTQDKYGYHYYPANYLIKEMNKVDDN